MLEQNILDLIQKIQSGSAVLSTQKTDDDVLVIYRAKFDPETGNKLPSEVVGTVTESQITEHLADRETEKARLNAFLESFGIDVPDPECKVDRTLVQRAFVSVLGPEKGVATWAWLWGQQFGGHPMIAYWISFLTLAPDGVDVNSADMQTALQALLAIPGADGKTPVLSGAEAGDIYDIIKASIG
jgi:hypothetical protein